MHLPREHSLCLNLVQDTVRRASEAESKLVRHNLPFRKHLLSMFCSPVFASSQHTGTPRERRGDGGGGGGRECLGHLSLVVEGWLALGCV